MNLRKLVIAAALLVAPMLNPANAGTLDTVKARGTLNCGVGESFPGFFAADATGRWSGLDVDFCRAVATAVLGDPEKVKYLPATPAARFAQLQSGQVDILSRSVTWIMSREAGLGLSFPVSPSSTARASSSASRPGSRAPANWRARRSAPRPGRRPSATSPTISASTT